MGKFNMYVKCMDLYVSWILHAIILCSFVPSFAYTANYNTSRGSIVMVSHHLLVIVTE